MYAAHVSLAAGRPWSCMPKWQYGDNVLTSLLFVFEISFLPKYRVNYYDYIILAGYPASLGREGEGRGEGGGRGREGPERSSGYLPPSSPPSLPLILFKTL